MPRLGPCATTSLPEGHCHKVEVVLPHLLEVHQVTNYLVHQLHCDSWYAACRHDHQLVLRLTSRSKDRYGVCYQCRPDVEKAIYHGSRAWAVSIIPLESEDNLSPEEEAAIKSALSSMQPD